MGGGGESAEIAFNGLKQYLVGHDPFQIEELRFTIFNPTASLNNNRTQLHAAIEFACLDIIGRMENKYGSIQVPEGPGLGVTLDRVKLNEYADF
jgi:L-alanine-DL-glutamate epimerase-like enolase superfamily enzyme